MPNGCPRNTMSAPATSLSLSHSPTPLFLISQAKALETTAHPPHCVPSPRKHTPRTECQKLGHLPRLRQLSRRCCASPDQSVEYVVGVTVLAAGHSNRHPPAVPHHRSNTKPMYFVCKLTLTPSSRSSRCTLHRRNVAAPPFSAICRRRRILPLRRPGDVDAEFLPPWANNHRLRRSLDLAASVSLLEEEYVEEEEDPAAGNDRLDEEFDAACDVADFQDGSN
uniref:Uncharacterized protein n=1 Tax=Oryza rufipogon TaxID=4529 RepID=A0A0E0Q7N4_ORYRU